MESLTNTIFGPYHLGDKIGSGGIADVYRALHVESRSSAAIKVMHVHQADQKDLVKGFTEEAELLRGFDHPGIPKFRRLGDIKGRPAMALEFIEGETLFALRQKKACFDLAGSLLAMAAIVTYVHQQGVVHNDLKLENFLLTPQGRLVLVDFGNARRPVSAGMFAKMFRRQIFGAGLMGTASYLAPELITGGDPSFASDCYALGVSAHILFTGSPPFDDTRRTKRLNRVVTENAPRITDRLPFLPKKLAFILDSCLEKDPGLRPQDGGALKKALKESLDGHDGMTPAKLSQLLIQTMLAGAAPAV